MGKRFLSLVIPSFPRNIYKNSDSPCL